MAKLEITAMASFAGLLRRPLAPGLSPGDQEELAIRGTDRLARPASVHVVDDEARVR